MTHNLRNLPNTFKVLLFMLILTVSFSCKRAKTNGVPNKDAGTETVNEATAAAPGWMADFEKFRTALKNGDKETVKSYFSFPIDNGNFELWFLAAGDAEVAEDLEENEPLPESFFDLSYDQIFPKSLIDGISKLDIEKLQKSGEQETELMIDGEQEYLTRASIGESNRMLTLENRAMAPHEFSVFYFFDIVDGQKIKFKKVLLAG